LDSINQLWTIKKKSKPKGLDSINQLWTIKKKSKPKGLDSINQFDYKSKPKGLNSKYKGLDMESKALALDD
jgi:hypothetical protein